jgi:hypothetical protein
MKALKIILVIILIAIAGIQFIPNHLPVNKEVTRDDLISSGNLPENIADMLRTSCYDCHSNQTKFPWYARVAPASWLLAGDIREGRDNLNFSDWVSFTKRHKIGKLEKIKEEINSGNMPLRQYLLIHRNAKLSPEQVKTMAKWADDLSNEILR